METEDSRRTLETTLEKPSNGGLVKEKEPVEEDPALESNPLMRAQNNLVNKTYREPSKAQNSDISDRDTIIVKPVNKKIGEESLSQRHIGEDLSNPKPDNQTQTFSLLDSTDTNLQDSSAPAKMSSGKNESQVTTGLVPVW